MALLSLGARRRKNGHLVSVRARARVKGWVRVGARVKGWVRVRARVKGWVSARARVKRLSPRTWRGWRAPG